MKKIDIEGSWKLVYAHIEENDSIQVKDLDKSDFIKIINTQITLLFLIKTKVAVKILLREEEPIPLMGMTILKRLIL